MNDHDIFADTMMIMQIWLAHTTSETNWACRFNHLNRVDLPTKYRGFSRPSMTDLATNKLTIGPSTYMWIYQQHDMRDVTIKLWYLNSI